MSHGAGDLVEMREIVGGPGGEELGQGDRAKSGMQTAAAEIFRTKIQRLQFIQIFRAHAGEFVEKLRERFALALPGVAAMLERLESTGFAKFQDHSCAGNPVGALAVNQVKGFDPGPAGETSSFNSTLKIRISAPPTFSRE